MPNARVAQIGQTGLNRPVYEVAHGTQRLAFSADETGRVRLRNRAYLRSLGIYSAVADKFSDVPSDAAMTDLRLASDYSTTQDDRFNVQSLGTGLAFVSDFKPFCGWVNLNPTFSRTI